MHIKIAGKIQVHGASHETIKWIASQLQIPNQSYQQAIRRNPKARYFLSEYISYFSHYKIDKVITVPRGFINQLTEYAEKNSIEYTIEDQRTFSPSQFVSTIKLRPYQETIPELLAKNDQGIIRLDTGFGKTIIAIRLAEILGQKTLFIVPTIDLLNQFVYEIKKWTDQVPGIIQGKKCDVQTLTVATLPSLRNRIRDGQLTGNEFGTVFVDECHKVVPEKSNRVIQTFSAYYRFGLTATLGRSDGQGGAIHFMFGDRLCNHTIPRAAPLVQIKEFTGYIPVEEYSDMIHNQVRNMERNWMIKNVVEDQLRKGRRVLILTKRVKHYEQLSGYFPMWRTYQMRSDTKKQHRATLLKGLRDGSIDYNLLLGTFSLLSTGIDIPSLDTLVIAGDLKSDILVEQSAGRILRLFDGKKSAKIIDIADTGNGILHHQFKGRKRFYKQQGWQVEAYVNNNKQLTAPL